MPKLYPLIFLQVLIISIFIFTPEANGKSKKEQPPKKIIAVYDIQGYQVPDVLTKALTERLRDEIFQRDIYRVVTRSDMESVFEEQGLQLSGACDDATCLVEIGKVLGAEYIIGGSVSKVEEKYTVLINTLDVATGELIYSSSMSKIKSSDKLLSSAISKVVDNLTQKRVARGLFHSPYFWGTAMVVTAAGTALLLSDENTDPNNNSTVEVIVDIP